MSPFLRRVLQQLRAEMRERQGQEEALQRAAVLAERNRLAGEIHDTLSQGFTGIVIQLEAAEDVLEDTPRQDLLANIRAVHQGQTVLSPTTAERLATHVRRDVPLSDRELAVLRLIRDGQSNKEIGAALAITEGTVKLHVNNLLSKLTARNRTDAVQIALKRGILHLD